MGWVDLVKTLINIVCQVNAAWEKDFKKRRLTHNTLPKVEKKCMTGCTAMQMLFCVSRLSMDFMSTN